MDPLHQQAILDCYDDLARDMDPGLVLRYSTVQWRDGDPGFIRARARTEGPHRGAQALLDKLLELPYDGFEDFVQSLKDVPYQHLADQLLESRERLQTAVNRGEKRRKDLGQHLNENVTKRTTRRLEVAGLILTTLMISACVITLYYVYTNGTDETPMMVVFPRRMKTFVGREDVFSKIDACLEQNQTCLIKGLEGVGKTSLAIEYGHRRAGRYPGGVFWVRVASKGDLCASISHYSAYVSEMKEGSLHSSDDMRRCNVKSVTTQFRKYLTKSRHWLLVVDEVVRETMKDLESLLPHSITATMNILLTSQEHQRLDMERISVIHLAPFGITEAQALFNKTVRSSSEDERRWVKSLSRSLGHHPLALQLAYAYIETTGCSVEDYYKKYIGANAAKKVDLLDKMGIDRTIRQTLVYTLQQLSPSAAALLNMTSFMGPDCIPCPNPDSEHFAKLKLFTASKRLDKLDTMEMVAELERFSLASRCDAFQPCAFSVNRIVQEVVIAEMEMNESLRLENLDKAVAYSTMMLSSDTSREQAEILLSNLHYLALHVDKYQTIVPVKSAHRFMRKSAEFFCRWGECEEAYLLLYSQMLLIHRQYSTQDLSCVILDLVNSFNSTLLRCLYGGDVPVDLLVKTADGLSLAWEYIRQHDNDNDLPPASCDVDQVMTSLENTSFVIYMRLLQSGKLNNVDYSTLPMSFFRHVAMHFDEMPFDTVQNILISNPKPNAKPEAHWLALDVLVGHAMELISQPALLVDLNNVLWRCGYEVNCDDKTKDTESLFCGTSMERFLPDLKSFRSDLQKAIKVVNLVLSMYYRWMDTSTCTNRYYEVMLGLPRESKEFDILEFAREDWHDLLGDPGVLKSVLSLTSPQNSKFRKTGIPSNLQQNSVRPLLHLSFHIEMSMKYLETIMELQLRKITGQTTRLRPKNSQSSPLSTKHCTALSDALALIEKNYEGCTWKQLKDQLQSIKIQVDGCYRLRLSLTDINVNHKIKSLEEKLKVLNATIFSTLFEVAKLMKWLEPSEALDTSQPEKYLRAFLSLLEQVRYLSGRDKTVMLDNTKAFESLKDCFVTTDRGIIMPSLCSGVMETFNTLMEEICELRQDLTMALVETKKGRYKINKIQRFLSSLWKFVPRSDMVGNPFVKALSDRSLVTPLKYIFDCKNHFPITLWVWNRLQEMLECVNCSLAPTGLNMRCLISFKNYFDTFLSDINDKCESASATWKTFLEVLGSDSGEIFTFDQKDDRVIGVTHKERKFALYYTGSGVLCHNMYVQDIRTSIKQKAKP